MTGTTSGTPSLAEQGSTRRVLVALILLLAAGYLGLLIPFRLWRRDVYRELAAHTTVMKADVGDIEYSIVGEGPPVLYVGHPSNGPRRPRADGKWWPGWGC